jgi:lysophospholipase L1-like esterase
MSVRTLLTAAAVRGRVTPPLALAFSAAAALAAEQLRRIATARQLGARPPPAFNRFQPSPRRRVLLVGDSTGLGVGCSDPGQSIAAQLARDFAGVELLNYCVNGATVADVLRQVRKLPPGERFDLVLVFAGGNDVLRRTPWRELRSSVRRLLAQLDRRSRHVLWAGMANVGLAPLFLPPFSWWMTDRTRRVNRLLAWEALLGGARFVEFFRERERDPFSAEPARYYARDGVHPSAEAYAWCYRRMKPFMARVLATPPSLREVQPLALG